MEVFFGEGFEVCGVALGEEGDWGAVWGVRMRGGMREDGVYSCLTRGQVTRVRVKEGR